MIKKPPYHLTSEEKNLCLLCGKCIKYLIEIKRIDILQDFLKSVENIEINKKEV